MGRFLAALVCVAVSCSAVWAQGGGQVPIWNEATGQGISQVTLSNLNGASLSFSRNDGGIGPNKASFEFHFPGIEAYAARDKTLTFIIDGTATNYYFGQDTAVDFTDARADSWYCPFLRSLRGGRSLRIVSRAIGVDQSFSLVGAAQKLKDMECSLSLCQCNVAAAQPPRPAPKLNVQTRRPPPTPKVPPVAAAANCQAVGERARQNCINRACEGNRWVAGGFSNQAHCAENCRSVANEETARCAAGKAKLKTTPHPPLPPQRTANLPIFVCTDITENVYVAMARPVGQNLVDVQGWWTVPAKGCVNLGNATSAQDHFFYAYSHSGDYIWPGKSGTQICLRSGHFKLTRLSLANPGQVVCPAGYERRPMQRKIFAGASEIRLYFNPD